MCYAVTASFVVFLIFASLWWPRAWIFIAISGIVWGAALSVFVTFSGISGGGVIFALAGVLELPVLLCYFGAALQGISGSSRIRSQGKNKTGAKGTVLQS